MATCGIINKGSSAGMAEKSRLCRDFGHRVKSWSKVVTLLLLVNSQNPGWNNFGGADTEPTGNTPALFVNASATGSINGWTRFDDANAADGIAGPAGWTNTPSAQWQVTW